MSHFVTPWTVARQAPRPWDSPGKHTGVGCHFLLQGIVPTQGSNPGLCIAGRFFTQILSHQGSPKVSKWFLKSLQISFVLHLNWTKQNFFFLIGVQLLYSVVLVSAVQQSKSAMRIHISPLPWISFPFRSTQGMEFPGLYSRSLLLIYFIHKIVRIHF